MAIDLQGQRVLLTGASGGIGAVLARSLAERGASLVLTARDARRLAETAASCEAAGAAVELVAVDLFEPEARAELMATRAGEIDVLINNAGVEYAKSLVAQTDAEVAAQLGLNLEIPIDLTRRALPQMLARKRGVIVNVASMSGKGSTPFNTIYAATKFGLVGLSSSLRMELRGTGVHVGAVCPGFVSAGMWERTGMRAPLALREVSAAQCSRAVLKVIGGAGEVLVTAGPIRPLLALFTLFPRLEAAMMGATGVTRTLAERAARLEQGE